MLNIFILPLFGMSDLLFIVLLPAPADEAINTIYLIFPFCPKVMVVVSFLCC